MDLNDICETGHSGEWLVKARELYSNKQIDLAIVAYANYIAHSPNDPVAPVELLKLYIGAGRPDIPLGVISLGIRNDASLIKEVIQFAERLYAEGRLLEALTIFSNLTLIAPEDHNAWNNLGVAMFTLMGKAEDCFKKALHLKAGYIDAVRNLAVFYKATGRTDEALQLCLDALSASDQQQPEAAADVSGLITEGERLFGEGRHEEALAKFLAANVMCPNDVENLNNMGVVLAEMKMFNEASEYLRKALEIDPGFVKAHDNLARLTTVREMLGAPKGCLELKMDNIQKFQGLISELKNGNTCPEVSNLPLELYIELTKRCNLDCIMCSHGIEVKRDPSKLGDNADFPIERFTVFDEFLPTAAMVYTVGLGEPALHKGFPDFVRKARDYGAFVWTNSNAMLLDEKVSKALVDAALSRMVLSVSAGSKKSYEHYYRGANWSRLWRNIENIHHAKLSGRAGLPQTFINYVVMDNNIRELPMLLEQMVPFDLDGIMVKPVVNMHGVLQRRKNAPSARAFAEEDKAFMDAANLMSETLGYRMEGHSYDESMRSEKCDGICLHPFSTLTVNSAGDVYPCGQGESVGDAALLLGSVLEQSLKDIWNGPKLAEIRGRMIRRDYGPGCRECIDKQLCRLHNDTLDPVAGIIAAAQVGCGTPGPVPSQSTEQNPESDEGLWPAPPSNDIVGQYKARNFYRYMLSQLRGDEIAFNSPIEVFLESANSCNLSCIFCSTRSSKIKASGPSALMSADVMKSIRSYLPGLATLSLHGFGEPFLNKMLVPAAVESVAYGVQVDFFTNGKLLTKKNAEALVKGNVSGFTVSISTADPERYERLYDMGKFDLLAKNLRTLNEYKKKYEVTKPVVKFNAIAMRETLADLPGLVRFADSVGVSHINLKALVIYSGLPEIHDQRISYDEQRDGAILREAHSLAKEFGISLNTEVFEASKAEVKPAESIGDKLTAARIEKSKTQPAKAVEEKAADAPEAIPVKARPEETPIVEAKPVKRFSKPCPLVYRTMYIRSDGKVKPCCFATFDDNNSLGDVTVQTVHEIWNGPGYKALRRAHSQCIVPPMCEQCYDFNLAPVSDSSRWWLSQSGIPIYDPGLMFKLFDSVMRGIANLRIAVDGDSAGIKRIIFDFKLLSRQTQAEFSNAKTDMHELGPIGEEQLAVIMKIVALLSEYDAAREQETKARILSLADSLAEILGRLRTGITVAVSRLSKAHLEYHVSAHAGIQMPALSPAPQAKAKVAAQGFKKGDKIFILGDSRTGTISLHHFLRALGLNAIHYYIPETRQKDPDSQYHEENWKNVMEFINTSGYDAFSDYPTRMFYWELSETYPDAYFILSTRSSVEKWRKSMVSYFGKRNVKFDLDDCTRAYIEMNQQIRDHFARTGQRFIEICIEDDSVQLSNRIKDFLGIKADAIIGWENKWEDAPPPA